MGALGPSQLSYSLNQWMIGIFKLGKISKIIESNHKPNIAKSTTEPGPYQGAHFRSLIRSIPLWTDNWKKGGGERDKQVWFIAAISYLLFGCRMAFGKDPHPSLSAGETHNKFMSNTSSLNRQHLRWTPGSGQRICAPALEYFSDSKAALEGWLWTTLLVMGNTLRIFRWKIKKKIIMLEFEILTVLWNAYLKKF